MTAPAETQQPATKSAIEAIKQKLDRSEARSTPGLAVLAPKQALLDARDVEKANPDLRVRWVSLKNPDKMLARKMEGYDVLPTEKGGKRLGEDLVLMGIPRAKYEARVEAQRKLTAARMKQHKTEMAGLAERLARELRDNHGIDINVDRLLVNEE